MLGKRIIMKNLLAHLQLIKPDVVIVRGISSFVLGQVVLSKIFLNFLLFTSTGQAYSALPKRLRDSKKYSFVRIKNILLRELPGKLFSYFVDSCIGSTEDCVDCVVDFYGVPREKTHFIPLGVDTDLFFPSNNSALKRERNKIRSKLGLSSDTILCIWTGRLTEGKAPWVLSEAVARMCDLGHVFHALFIGSGPEEEKLLTYKNSTLLPFMKWSDLPTYYRAADIAVWPRLITTSTLDASACGLPVVMSNKERATERWDGIGLTYEECEVDSLMKVLNLLANDKYRFDLGCAGVNRMKNEFSWKQIANKFISHFNEFL
jgi:glycosyltransferase involved in cell wall biosynthesis